MKIKRIISLILCLIMALPVISCSNTADPAEGSSDETTKAPAATVAPDTSAVVEETESPYDENGFLKSSLPEELDFKLATLIEPAAVVVHGLRMIKKMFQNETFC